MRYLKISNKGEIEEGAFTLIGASTKVNDSSKIGMFGSGLNYAIAFLLRNNIDFKIFSGEQEIVIGKQPIDFRGNDYEVITVNGKATNFTITMGKDWLFWYAIREIYCNALDEINASMCITDELRVGEANRTSFYIQETEQTSSLIKEWDIYFSNKREDILYETREITIYRKLSTNINIYRKGVRCYNSTEPSIFDYDLSDVSINESRVADNEWQLKGNIARELLKCNNPKVVKLFLDSINNATTNDLEELEFSYSSWCGEVSDAYKEFFEKNLLVQKEIAGHYIQEIESSKKTVYCLPANLCTVLMRILGTDIHISGTLGKQGIKYKEPDTYKELLVNKAKKVLESCDFPIEYDIKYCQFINDNSVRAFADLEDKTIYMDDSKINSVFDAAVILLEEAIHISTGYKDTSRQLQNHIFAMLLEEKLKRFGEVL